MPLAVPGDLRRIDRIYRVAGGQQRLNPGTTVGLDAHHDVLGLGIVGQMVGDQRVQLRQALHPVRHPSADQHLAGLVAHLHIVMRLSPVVAHEQHGGSLRLGRQGGCQRNPASLRRRAAT